MTFAAKYEILEAVTRGAVETFVARKIATDERVLVYIFECQEQPLNKPTVQWVLESFRAVAPEPPELVAETGRYDATSYGYLVTKVPERSKLQTWIQSYEARQQTAEEAVMPPGNAPATGARESAKELANTLPASERPTRVFGSERPEEITKAFEALRSELEPPSADSSPSAAHAESGSISAEFGAIRFEGTAAAQPNKPGDFTRQFFSGFEDELGNTSAQLGLPPREDRREPSGLTEKLSPKGIDKHAGTDAAAETPSSILRKIVFSTGDSAGSSGVYPASSSGSAAPPKPAPPGSRDKAAGMGTGDFTKFFRGPFDGQRPAETPDLSPAVAREQKDTGDFTRVFGPPKRESSPPLTSSPSANRNAFPTSESGSFTSFFDSAEVPKKTSSAYESAAPVGNRLGTNNGVLPPTREQTSPTLVSRPARIAVDIPSSGAPASTSSERALPFSSRTEPEGATRVFSVTERDPAPSLSTLQAGPSEYTRIISMGPRKPSASGELTAAAGPQDSPSAGVAAPPGVPAIPAAPPLPQFPPPGGQAQVPVPPVITSPPAPQGQPPGPMAPKVAGPPWTMILILNGLFILAVLLVLYFVLRH